MGQACTLIADRVRTLAANNARVQAVGMSTGFLADNRHCPKYQRHGRKIIHTRKEKYDFLTKVSLFEHMEQECLPALSMILRKRVFPEGTVILQQGDQAQVCYIIKRGQVKVHVDDEEVVTLGKNDYFGENSLLNNTPLLATMIAKTKVTLYTISRDAFRGLGLHLKLQQKRRKAIERRAGPDEAVSVKPPSPKTDEERQIIKEAFRQNLEIQTFCNLADDLVDELADIAWTEEVLDGELLIKEGDEDGAYFFIVRSGAFEAFVEQGQTKTKTGAQGLSFVARMHQCTPLRRFTRGGSFGELALLFPGPRRASVRAIVNDSSVWVIDRPNFKKIILKDADNKALEQVKFLDHVKDLRELPIEDKQALAKSVRRIRYSKGKNIIVEGEPGTCVCIVIEGDIIVKKAKQQVSRLKATQDAPQVFAEGALLRTLQHPNTVTVVSDEACVLTLDRKTLGMQLKCLEKIATPATCAESRAKRRSLLAAATVQPTVKAERKFGLIKKADLKQVALLGCGGFGAVRLVEHRRTKETYALKVISKGYVVRLRMQRNIVSEKSLQLMCNSFFIIKLYETFRDRNFLYLLLEVALGGELYNTYFAKNLFGEAEHTQYYVASVVLAFEHMHSKFICFRDLKPENIVLTHAGFPKVTDMGLAKVVVGKTYSLLGTLDYFAPEMIESTGHDQGVDWWTLGVLTFDLMTGAPPFESESQQKTYKKIREGISRVDFPYCCQGAIEDFVKALCHRKSDERLPMRDGGVTNIENHRWFVESNFDWHAMRLGNLKPLYVPNVKNKRDASNFSANESDVPPQIEYHDDRSGWDDSFATSR